MLPKTLHASRNLTRLPKPHTPPIERRHKAPMHTDTMGHLHNHRRRCQRDYRHTISLSHPSQKDRTRHRPVPSAPSPPPDPRLHARASSSSPETAPTLYQPSTARRARSTPPKSSPRSGPAPGPSPAARRARAEPPSPFATRMLLSYASKYHAHGRQGAQTPQYSRTR